MAKRCSNCTKRRSRVNSNISSVVIAQNQSGVSILNAQDFKLVYYIGTDNDEVPSTQDEIKYGKRKYGQRTMVHIDDLENNSDIWAVEMQLPVPELIEEGSEIEELGDE